MSGCPFNLTRKPCGCIVVTCGCGDSRCIGGAYQVRCGEHEPRWIQRQPYRVGVPS